MPKIYTFFLSPVSNVFHAFRAKSPMAMKHTSYCKTVVESGNRALAARRMSLGTTGQVGNIKVARFGGKTKTSFRVYSSLFSLP